MSHRRVKNIAYDASDDFYTDDDVDAFDDHVNYRDEQLLRSADIVKQRIQTVGIIATDKQILDSLWHYYYDVEKSVKYLSNICAKPSSQSANDAPQPQPSQLSRFDQAMIQKSQVPRTIISSNSYPRPGISPTSTNLSAYFEDIPWLNVAPHRLGNLMPIKSSHYSKGGLLGGSSNTSKLAALVATKKAASRSGPGHGSRSGSGSRSPSKFKSSVEKSRAIALLDQLKLESSGDISLTSSRSSSSSDTLQNTSVKPSTHFPLLADSANGSTVFDAPLTVTDSQSVYSRTKCITSSQSSTVPVLLSANPSLFARVLVGTIGTSNTEKKCPCIQTKISLVYSGLPNLSNPFTTPSPDDRVLQARIKGTKVNSIVNDSTNVKGKSSDTKCDSKSTIGLAGKESSPVNTTTAKVSKSGKYARVSVIDEWHKLKDISKPSASFAVIGHVDHGKSTLMGCLLADLNAVTSRSLDKLQKEANILNKASLALAYVMDSNKEEREKGVTIDVSTRTIETQKSILTILDTPGHQDFVSNMITGAALADFAVLVIDAAPGGFESGLAGQTHEHALIVRSIGAASTIIVVINKMDLVNWSRTRFAEIRDQMKGFLTRIGFPTQRTFFIPCSALQGNNVVVRHPKCEAFAWYTGPSLLEALDTAAKNVTLEELLRLPVRIEVYEAYSEQSNSVVVVGRLLQGTVQVGEELVILPNGIRVKVTNIRDMRYVERKKNKEGESIDEEPRGWAISGSLVHITLQSLSVSGNSSSTINEDNSKGSASRLNVKNVGSKMNANLEVSNIRQGNLIVPLSAPLPLTREIVARILAFEELIPMHVDVYIGLTFCDGRIDNPILEIVQSQDKKGKGDEGIGLETNGKRDKKAQESLGQVKDGKRKSERMKHPRIVCKGQIARVRIVLGEDYEASNRVLVTHGINGGELTGGKDSAKDIEGKGMSARSGVEGLYFTGLPVESGKRIILRWQGNTIGAGVVE